MSAPAASGGALQWTFAGPYGATGSSAGMTSGRVSAIVVDPRDRTGRTVVYASGAQGGIWKTTDGGNTWKPLTDNQPTLAIGSLALDPSNPDIVYAGTGEETFSPASPPAFGGAFYGMGVLKSTDAGATWALYNGPFAGPFGPTFYDGGARIGSLAVSPSNLQVILAAADFHNPAKSGIYRSTDGGVTWTLVLGGASGTEVLFNPSNGNTAWAALGDPFNNTTKTGVYQSVDGGLTWKLNGLSLGSDAGRIRLAISSDGSTLYVGVHSISTGGALGIWKTTNGGSGWGHLTNAPEYCRDTCYYHNVIRVSPVNANIVVAAGITPRRSLDGGSTWTDLYLDKNGLTIHPDQHALAWSADGTRLYVGTDGGVYSTDDLANTPNTFTSLNATLGITQYYQGVSILPGDPTVTFAGSQDNGTMKSGSPQWQTIACGDGGRTLIDTTTTPYTVYTSCAGGPLPQKSVDGGATFSDANDGISNERTSFSAPFSMDPSNPKRLYYGTDRVYVSNNAGATWTPISGDLTGTGPVFALTTITVAPSSSNTVYAACGNDGTQPMVWVSTNATAGSSSTWTQRSAGLPLRPPSQIAVDPNYPQTAYISFMGFSGYNGDTAGHVFRTSNGGAAWTDISGNLPNTEVNDLLLDPSLPSTIYAATDIGVFWTLDGGVHWTQLGTGLPRMEVLALAMHQKSRTLRAATYGRSMWDLNIPLPSPVIPPGSIVNSAWPSSKMVAPGSIASLYGTSLALDTLLVPAPWPQTLGGASILTNSKPAAMYYVSPGQINFQVPWEAAGSTQGSVSITTGGVQSAAQSFNLAATAPGLFTTNQQGTGQAAALVANTAIVAAPTGTFPGSRPVQRGVEYLEFYGTGLGPVTHTPATGAPAPVNPLAQTIASASVTIGGVPATVTYCGLSPYYVGLYQVDVQVPANAPTGSAVPVTLTIGGVAANSVTVAVQ
jgi:uncharacterized protein (TIGR03437 family)